MAFVINASDITHFEALSAPRSITEIIPSESVTESPSYYHPSVGKIKFSKLSTGYMQVTDMRFELLNDFELHDVDSTDTININFFLNGSLDTTFSGLCHEFNMRPNFHNLVYSPEGRDVSRVSGAQNVEMLHISLQRDFFVSCLGHDDVWGEHILENLRMERPFVGSKINPETTPQMTRLIQTFRSYSEPDPMRILLMQSRILELLALQINQFRAPAIIPMDIRPDEAEKLHQLKTFLDSNFLSDLSLTQLSKVCLLNEFKVKRGFKILFGTTVFNYLRKLRMEYASSMLTYSSTSIDEVADALGYEHTQHFSTAFKKYIGVSPSIYQKKGRAIHHHRAI
ncbi:AraC family transcriptional regulator [Dyadobacter sp. CY345]|uniref:helix-turn-helix transcriptional regulator n=1 Tax=Dyadobacter sp. CY345 TaxID=2909335 RepID=UPI001F15CE22|nr:AraC family transcriptional regulator [Dyadobacter sp. CY345]MCF2446829.1 AraC family transcriptional regulator [Dyadobacter sp. CY345]